MAEEKREPEDEDEVLGEVTGQPEEPTLKGRRAFLGGVAAAIAGAAAAASAAPSVKSKILENIKAEVSAAGGAPDCDRSYDKGGGSSVPGHTKIAHYCKDDNGDGTYTKNTYTKNDLYTKKITPETRDDVDADAGAGAAPA